MFFHSVRFRLALWFALVLAFVLLLFSLFVYYRTAQDIREYTASRLVSRLRDINAIVLRQYREQAGWYWWREPDADEQNAFVLNDNEILLISDPNGDVVGYWGTVNAVEAARVARTVAQSANGSFLSYTITAKNSPGTRQVDYLFNPAQILYENRQLGWIIVGLPVDQDNQMRGLILTLALAGGLTLLAALAGGYWLANRALWPVKTITRTAREIGETDLTRRLNLTGSDELGELARTFDQMLDRLQAAFTRQRQFTADASHELRTPLSIINLETGRALSGQRSPEAYRRALEVVRSENEFMTSLVEKLLTLARMDSGSANFNNQPHDLSDITLEVIERYAPLAAQHNIRIHTGALPELIVNGDRQYLLQMIGNLIENAIKYSAGEQDAQVWVDIGKAENEQPPQVWLRVTDNGPGIQAEHLPFLFDRFYRVDRARSHNFDVENPDNTPGSGLGLSIVQWIAQAHAGSVSVQSTPGEGSVFEIRLPLVSG